MNLRSRASLSSSVLLATSSKPSLVLKKTSIYSVLSAYSVVLSPLKAIRASRKMNSWNRSPGSFSYGLIFEFSGFWSFSYTLMSMFSSSKYFTSSFVGGVIIRPISSLIFSILALWGASYLILHILTKALTTICMLSSSISLQVFV